MNQNSKQQHEQKQLKLNSVDFLYQSFSKDNDNEDLQ